MGFSRQGYWSGIPCLPPGDIPNPGIEPTSFMSPAWADGFFGFFWQTGFLSLAPPGKQWKIPLPDGGALPSQLLSDPRDTQLDMSARFSRGSGDWHENHCARATNPAPPRVEVYKSEEQTSPSSSHWHFGVLTTVFSLSSCLSCA